MQIEMKLASESHVPRFRAGVGTWRSGYMIPIRLPWRHRARPSATLHEIQVCPEGQTCAYDATQPTSVRQPANYTRVKPGSLDQKASAATHGGRAATSPGPTRRRLPSTAAPEPAPGT